MSARYSCDMCQADIPAEDAERTTRTLSHYIVPYVRASFIEGTPEFPGGCHLCIPCICKVLTEGKPANPDETPF